MSTGRGNYGIGGTNSNYLQSLSAFSRDDFSGNESTTKAKQEAQTRTRISQLEKRINRSKIQPLIPISVEITDSTAVLRGVVKNEYQRRLAEQYVRLEPGILTVQNELVCSQELNISLPEEGKD